MFNSHAKPNFFFLSVWYDLKDKISFEYKFLKFAFFLKKKFSFLNFKTTKNMAV
jgi:hypothetical protein